MTTKHATVESIAAEARRAALRMRLARALGALPSALTLAFSAGIAVLAGRKIAPEHVPERATWLFLGVAALGVLVVVLVALLRRLPPKAGALALDRHHRLDGRLTNALAFAELAAGERTPLMELAIGDACTSAKEGLSATAAVRLPIPGELGVSALVAAGLLGVSLLEVRTWEPYEVPGGTETARSLELADDDLALFRDSLKDLEEQNKDPVVKAAIVELNRLLEDIAEKRMSREEAIRKLRELEDRLTKGSEEERKALEQALKQMANELQQSELAQPTSEALKKKDLGRARESLKSLAKSLKSKNKPDKGQLERLRRALDRASKANEETVARLKEKRAELEKSLLAKKQEAKPAAKKDEEREKSLLRKKERELERLGRELENRQKAARRLSRLDRQLGKAAADLLRDLGMSAEELEDLAEELNRLEQEELSEKEKDELRQRMEELRELIRQQGQGGKKLQQRLKRFMQRAGGKGQGGGKKKKRGQGKGDQGEGSEGDDGDLRPGQGNDGEGEGEGEGNGGLRLGQGGKRIPIEIPGGGSGEGEGEGAGQEPGGEGKGEGGKSWGKGTAEKLGQSSSIDGKTVDVRAEGLDDKGGPTNAEVILGAADRGFAGKPYKKVFKQYRTVAEEQIDKEKIPDGMRFYVRRYFQLIRPRE